MDMSRDYVGFLIRLLLLAAAVHFASRQAVSSGLLPWASIWVSVAVAWTSIMVYTRLIHPFFFDNLQHLPVVDVPDVRVIMPITDFPRGDFAVDVATKHQDQDMVRLRLPGGNRILFLISTAAIRDVFGINQNDFVKPEGGRNFLSRVLGYGLILSEGNVHTRQRKRLTQSFRVQNIRALHDLMLLKTEIMLKNMQRANKESPEKGIDVCTWASKVTLDIIGNALMSKEYDSLNAPRVLVNEAFGRLTTASPSMTTLFALSLAMPQFIVRNLPMKINREIDQDVAIIRKSCELSLDEVKARMSTGKYDSTDILASIVADPEASRTEVIDQMMTFLGAGHETTATSIAWAAHLLTLPHNLHYQDRIREEVLANPDCTKSPTALESLPWVNAICEETLRLYPPVTNTARTALRDTTVAGVKVTRGSLVAVFPWAVNRLPRYWGGDDAGKFVPERWIDTKPDGTLSANNNGGAESNYCNMTFLHGNRSCIGKGFAKAELRVVMAKLYSEYTLRRLPGDDLKANPVGSLTVKPEGGLWVTMKAVE